MIKHEAITKEWHDCHSKKGERLYGFMRQIDAKERENCQGCIFLYANIRLNSCVIKDHAHWHLAQACSFFALLMLISSMKKHRNSSSLLKVFKVNFYLKKSYF